MTLILPAPITNPADLDEVVDSLLHIGRTWAGPLPADLADTSLQRRVDGASFSVLADLDGDGGPGPVRLSPKTNPHVDLGGLALHEVGDPADLDDPDQRRLLIRIHRAAHSHLRHGGTPEQIIGRFLSAVCCILAAHYELRLIDCDDDGEYLNARDDIAPGLPVAFATAWHTATTATDMTIDPGRSWTHPDVLTIGVRDGWADRETDPARIDWAPRLSDAAIPFTLVDGRPVNPCERTSIRYGRNELGHWGEALAADAIVTATTEHGWRWIVLAEREDGHGWALPGGHVDPGEDPTAAAVRELAEETSLVVDLATVHATTLPARYVPDPRASDEAWMVTVPTLIDLGALTTLPDVVGCDDARRAVWAPAPDLDTLTRHLDTVYQGTVFAAHHALLAEALT